VSQCCIRKVVNRCYAFRLLENLSLDKTVIVVIDTNVFVRDTHLLRKKGGPALIRLLRATRGQLLIPEILHREYVEQTVAAADEHRSKVEKAFSALETLLGERFQQPVPDGEAVRFGAINRLRALEVLTQSDPLTPELYAAAGTRSLEKRRPTSKTDHGYKDCLIWESVLRLPPGSEVMFISRDNPAFFEGDAFHPGLVAEARTREITVVGYQNIESVVEELAKANPALDLAAFEGQTLDEQVPVPEEEVAPPAPVPLPAEAAEHGQPTAGSVEEVVQQLSEAQKRFDNLNLKVLAYIAYLDSVSKDDIFDALADSGVAPDIVKNIAERLAINGYVRDTGNHYLVVSRTIGELAAPTVEAEIIAWLEKKRRRDGK
jgi:hypothetical protein